MATWSANASRMPTSRSPKGSDLAATVRNHTEDLAVLPDRDSDDAPELPDPLKVEKGVLGILEDVGDLITTPRSTRTRPTTDPRSGTYRLLYDQGVVLGREPGHGPDPVRVAIANRDIPGIGSTSAAPTRSMIASRTSATSNCERAMDARTVPSDRSRSCAWCSAASKPAIRMATAAWSAKMVTSATSSSVKGSTVDAAEAEGADQAVVGADRDAEE